MLLPVFAEGGPERSGDPDHAGELYVIHLIEDSQRRGAGRRLVTSVASDLARNGMRSMLVWVLEQNRPACLFYEALGGLPAREQEVSIGGVTLAEVGYGWPDIGPLTYTPGQASSAITLRASSAAARSARALRDPVPVPMGTPSTTTSAVKRLAWSWPSTFTIL